MSDYIKREDAIRTMAKYMMDMALIDNPEASDRIEEWEGNIAAPVMSTVKAADVVEVVRCKDCKHHYSWKDVDDCFYHACERWSDNLGYDADVDVNYFCSFGERAEA